MALPSSPNTLSFSQIEGEFGQNPRRSLGEYRIADPDVGDLGTLGLDNDGTGGNLSPTIPTSGTIRFSDFHGKRLNIVVDYWSGGEEVRPEPGFQRYGRNKVKVIGGFRSKPSSSSGCKIYLHVNKTIGSEVTDNGADIELCAVKTGRNWGGNTVLRVDVGGNGKILGAGGKGGKGGRQNSDGGKHGSRGSSGLGIAYNCDVHVKNGGLIAGGGGGGGGGGGAYQDDAHNRHAAGGGGGGGAGFRVGAAGPESGKGPKNQKTDNKKSYARGEAGQPGSKTSGGQGGRGGNNRSEAIGGNGGTGGGLGQDGGKGGNGSSNKGQIGQGATGGHAGDSIRRALGSYTLYNNGQVLGNQQSGGIR